jgi:tRNA pseudouridine38-40 synthase
MRLALLIEYDGTDFSGWQIQENGRSVQGDITKAFGQLFGREFQVHGAGRTDAGVHGRGMVAHVDLPVDIEMTVFKLIIALNATTPADIVIRDIRPVPDDFHARHSALSRQYRYTIKRERTAIDRHFVWAIKRNVDESKLQAVASLLPGEHDFTSFSKRSNDVEHYRCSIEEARWDFQGTTYAFTIRANRFVRGMVRALVGAMVQAGQDLLSTDEFAALLDGPQEFARAKYLAPAHGLVLEGIAYPERFGLWHIDLTTPLPPP